MARPPVALDHATPQLVSPAAAGRLADDLPCKRCGYNLRGLPGASACPECALLIERSLRGDLLRDSSPEYLRRLVRGLRLAYWGGFATVALPFVIGAATIFAALLPALGAVIDALFVVFYSGPLVLAVGWWLAALPDPGVNGSDRDRVRLAVRWSAGAFGGLVVAATALESARLLGASNSSVITASGAVGYGVFTALGLHWLASVVYLQRLGDRVPDRDVRAEGRRILRAVGVTLAAFLVAALAPRAAALLGGTTVGSVMTLAGLTAFFAPLYALLKYIGIAGRLLAAAREALLISSALDNADGEMAPAGAN